MNNLNKLLLSKKTVIVAEMSANHCQSLKKALKIIDEAKIAGADALKIQVFSKECQKETNCKISQSNPKIEGELKVAILKRATKYKKDMVDSTPKRPINTILTSDDKN